MNLIEFADRVKYKHDWEYYFYNKISNVELCKCKRCSLISFATWTYSCISDDEFMIKSIIE